MEAWSSHKTAPAPKAVQLSGKVNPKNLSWLKRAEWCGFRRFCGSCVGGVHRHSGLNGAAPGLMLHRQRQRPLGVFSGAQPETAQARSSVETSSVLSLETWSVQLHR
jgi:hypothetical protein